MKNVSFSDLTRRLVFLLSAFAMHSVVVLAQQDCIECDIRYITCWDLDILTPSPVTEADSINWKLLHYASDSYQGRYLKMESRPCIALIPACRIVTVNPPWEDNCPYRGEKPGGQTDFELIGEIIGQEGDYTLTLTLVTLSHERVAEVTKSFSKAPEAVAAAQDASLHLGGTETGSKMLNDVIREWEIKRRDEANGTKINRTAINAKLKFVDAPAKVQKGSRVPLKVEIRDCDDKPIRAAQLDFQTLYGQFENNQVLTDENGIAHAVYISPDKSIKETVTAYFYYDRPGGREMTAAETIEFEVGDGPHVSISGNKDVITTNDIEQVFIQLKEGDPERLRAARLEISCTNGKMTPAIVRPDANGKTTSAYIPSQDKAGMDTITVTYRYALPDGSQKQISDTRVISVLYPQIEVPGDLHVRIFEKTTEKEAARETRITEREIEYRAGITVKLNRENLLLLLDKIGQYSPELSDIAVIQGDSYNLDWGENQVTSDDVGDLINPIDINEKIRITGYRGSGDDDWGELYTADVYNTINFQHVAFSLKPYAEADEATGKLQFSGYYLMNISTVLIPEQIKSRDYSSTSQGEVKEWNPVIERMTIVPPPFSCVAPYANDCFQSVSGNEIIEPPLVPTYQVTKYILRTKGDLIITTGGRLFRSEEERDTEIIMVVTVILH